MAGTIEFIQSVVKTSKKEWEQKFPGIEDILIVHNSALEKLAPTYFQSYIDHADSAFYAMIRCNPLKGDCSRQMACKWLDEFMYEKCGCPSSYDIKSGMHPTEEHPDFGTMSRKVAISKELLPADNDAEYMDYYQEQMAKMKEMFSAEQKAAAKEEFIAKNGFDPDDPDIIGIEVDGEPVAQAGKAPGTTSVEQSAGTAVGMPKPIWYGFVVHADGFGMKLGYDKKVWTLSQGATTLDKLGFDPAGPQLTEKEEDEMVGEAQRRKDFYRDRIRAMKRMQKGRPVSGKFAFYADVDFLNLAGTEWYDANKDRFEEFEWKGNTFCRDNDSFSFAFDHEPKYGEITDKLAQLCKAKWGIAPYQNVEGECAIAVIMPADVADSCAITDDESAATDPLFWENGMIQRFYPNRDSADYIDYSEKYPNGNAHIVDGQSGKAEPQLVSEALIGRTAGMISRHILDAIGLAGKGTGLGLALGDVYEKFFGPLPANLAEKEADECEKCGDDSCKDGEKCGLKEDAQNAWKQKMVLKDADGNVLDSYEWECSGDEQANSDGVIEAISKFDAANPEAGFVDANDEIFDALVIDQAPWTDGTFTIELDPAGLLESKNPYDETDEETVSEIKEILDEEDRGMEDELDEYAKIEDDVEEDDEEELSESVIRHATMLAREIR